MRLDELKKIEESFFSNIFPSGKLPGSGLSGVGKAPTVKNFQTQLAKEFIDDFYRDAVTSLENGIDGGYIDTSKTGFSNQPAQPEPQGQEQTGQPSASSRNAAPANNAQQSSNTTYPGLAAGIQVVSNDPLIFKYKNTDYSLDDEGEWANTKTKAKASETLQAFFNKQADAVENALTIKNPNANAKNSNNETAQQNQSTQDDIKVTWNDPLTIKLKGISFRKEDDGNWYAFDTQQNNWVNPGKEWQEYLSSLNIQPETSSGPTNENAKYEKLNRLFENIMREMIFPTKRRKKENDENSTGSAEPAPGTADSAEPAPGTAEEDLGQVSIAEYMLDWFTQYMQGVNWQSRRSYVEKFLLKFEKEYDNKKLTKQNLLNLGKVAFAMSKAGAARGQYAAGAPDSMRNTSGNNNNATSDNQSFRPSIDDSDAAMTTLTSLADTNPNELKRAFEKLKNRDSRAADRLKNAISENKKRRR